MASPRALSPCSEAERAYLATCTLPPKPKECGKCKGKAELRHLNVEKNYRLHSVFVCASISCPWPFTPYEKGFEEFSGSSDVKLYHKWQEEVKKKKRKNEEMLHSGIASSTIIWGSSRYIEQNALQAMDKFTGNEVLDEQDINKKLPKEIVEQILLRLPFSMLRNTVPFVCKSWAKYVQSIPFWRTYIRKEIPYM